MGEIIHLWSLSLCFSVPLALPTRLLASEAR